MILSYKEFNTMATQITGRFIFRLALNPNIKRLEGGDNALISLTQSSQSDRAV